MSPPVGNIPNAESERLQTQALRKLLDRIAQLEAASAESSDPPEPESDLDLDDRATNSIQLSHSAQFCLAMAIDGLRSVRLLFEEDSDPGVLTIPMIAQFAMIRMVIESSSQALWLLQPQDRSLRVERLLQTRMSEIAYDFAFSRTANEVHPADTPQDRRSKQAALRAAVLRRRERIGYCRHVAEGLGIAHHAFANGAPGFAPMIASIAAGVGLRPSSPRGMWQLVSGLSHPSIARAVNSLNREETGPAVANVHTIQLTADLSTQNAALNLAIFLYESASRLYSERLLRVMQM